MRVERIALKQHSDLAFFGLLECDIKSTKSNMSLGYCFQSGDHSQNCGLAAARRSDEHGK